MAWAATAQEVSPRTVSITFDDFPAVVHAPGNNLAAVRAIDLRLLSALKKHHAQAIGFVIESKVVEDDPLQVRVGVLDHWVSSGMVLGNHTFSHLDYNKVTTGTYERDTLHGEQTIRPLMEKYHQTLRFFRYPFNHLGETPTKRSEMLKFLAEHHYDVATCTVETSDWMFDAVYYDANKNGDRAEVQRIRDAYLKTTDSAFAYFEKRSVEVLGREFPQVLLLHANQLNADVMDDLLSLLERRGYSFVSLEKAQADPAYKSREDYAGPNGWMWTLRWALANHKDPDVKGVPLPPLWVISEFDRLQRVANGP